MPDVAVFHLLQDEDRVGHILRQERRVGVEQAIDQVGVVRAQGPAKRIGVSCPPQENLGCPRFASPRFASPYLEALTTSLDE